MISFKKVYKTYSGNIHALADIDLQIKPDEFVCLVGPSGAGKSTLVKLINREEKATRGKVLVAGKDVGQLESSQLPFLRRRIGFVFQDFKLLSKKTVYENVAFALEVAGASNEQIKKTVSFVLKMVGLAGKEDKFPCELSGGEEQRVALARALVHQPKILIADEPTGNLDIRTAWGVIELLAKINKFGTTVILATHNKEIVNRLRKRVVVLEEGKITSDKRLAKYTL
jgi:cell division transport system ATP-binding protein